MEITLEKTAELLVNYSNIVVTAHIHPDGDSLGSMLALSAYLTAAGKNVQMMLDDEIPGLYGFLPDVSQITRPNAHKVKADLLIILDASDLERIGRVKDAIDAPVLNIDHHISNTKFADYLLLDSNAAATGEIILRLLKLLKADINAAIATNLYTAIATDCGFFRYANTSADTMRYCAELIDYGVKPHLVSEELEAKPLASVINLSKILETLDLFYDGRIATITVAADMMADHESTEGFINYPRIIEGVEIAIMFKAADHSTCRVSLRSKRVDVSRLALSFGGGGHARAAGCTLNGSLTEVKAKVVAAAIKELQEFEHG